MDRASLLTCLALGTFSLVVACGKAGAPPPPPPAPAVVVSVARPQMTPPMGTANISDEDTMSDVADVVGEDASHPLCRGVRLELVRVTKRDGKDVLSATVVNAGSRTVTLVEPGDGSESGWRTPVIRWRVSTPSGDDVSSDPGPRCGNMDAIREDEVFDLAPGARHRLSAIYGPFVSPGRYVVRMVYDNDPAHGIRGFRDEHDPKALARIKASTACRLESTPVTVDL